MAMEACAWNYNPNITTCRRRKKKSRMSTCNLEISKYYTRLSGPDEESGGLMRQQVRNSGALEKIK
jgi:hypothetical protein